MPDQLANHFADVMDRQDAERTKELAEASRRAQRLESNCRMDEEEHRELVMLADELERGLQDMQKFFRQAGFYIPLIENIKRDGETSVTFICAGQQYQFAGSSAMYSTPARLYIQMRIPLLGDPAGEWGWCQIHHSGLPPGPEGDARLVQQMMDYMFEKTIEKLVPAARARLDAFVRGPAPPTTPQAMP